MRSAAPPGPADAPEDQPAPGHPARACLVIDARAERVTVAREFIGEVLGRGHPCVETAILLASELVTNSVRHSDCRRRGQGITVAAIPLGSGIRIEVTDISGPTVPAFRTGGALAEGGRGLQLVLALAANWGYWCDGGLTTTWFTCTPLIPQSRGAPSEATSPSPATSSSRRSA